MANPNSTAEFRIVRIPAWEAEIGEYVAEKLGLSLQELVAFLLRKKACDAQPKQAKQN